jgi:hypothetical protein
VKLFVRCSSIRSVLVRNAFANNIMSSSSKLLMFKKSSVADGLVATMSAMARAPSVPMSLSKE